MLIGEKNIFWHTSSVDPVFLPKKLHFADNELSGGLLLAGRGLGGGGLGGRRARWRRVSALDGLRRTGVAITCDWGTLRSNSFFISMIQCIESCRRVVIPKMSHQVQTFPILLPMWRVPAVPAGEGGAGGEPKNGDIQVPP